MNFCVERTIPPDHPSLPGHFPGNPLVPGVVILEAVAAALQEWQPALRIAAVTEAKFVSPLLPGERFTIELERAEAGRPWRFVCRLGERVLAQGRLALEAA